ncbi:MAG: hypothetical protein ACREI9_01960 [Nitrospiraceae bacterium]
MLENKSTSGSESCEVQKDNKGVGSRFSVHKPSLFDNDWVSSAATQAPQDSWARYVLTNLSGTGGIYLTTLRTWFARFPKASTETKNQLGSFMTSDHLGAVNEIFWWEWMKQFCWSAEPVKGKKHKRPDYHVSKPADFFCEVTTQNISDEVREQLSGGDGVDLNHERAGTIERLFLKIQREKLGQIQYGAFQKRPSVLVLFDYTFWSGLGVPFDELAEYLFGKQNGFASLPSELSAIVYVDRTVRGGRLGMSQLRSAVYHNPCAQFRLPKSVLPMICQYDSKLAVVSPAKSLIERDGWIWVE